MSNSDGYEPGGAPEQFGPVNLFGASRSFRNNNPGNLVYSPFSQQQGAVGKDANGFAVFPDIATGNAAQRALWGTQKYSQQPIGQLLGSSWVGAGRGSNYASQLGIDPTQTFAQLNAQQQQTMLDAQRKMEGYKGPPGVVAPATPTYAAATPSPSPTVLAMAEPVTGDPYAP